MKKLSLISLAVIGLGSIAGAQTIAYNNLDASGGFTYGTGATVSGSNSAVGTAYSSGFDFVSGASGMLTDIKVGYSYVAGVNLENFDLYTDNGGVLGTDLGTFSASSPNASGGAIPLTDISVTNGPMLNAGSTYWLVASAGDPTNFSYWNFNDTGVTGTEYQSANGVGNYFSNQSTGSMELTVQSVPAPASIAILALGVIGLISLRRRS